MVVEPGETVLINGFILNINKDVYNYTKNKSHKFKKVCYLLGFMAL